MRLTIEIAAAALLVVCISATSAAFCQGRQERRWPELFLQCRARRFARGALCGDQAAVWRKFYANYCGDKLLSAM